MNRKLLFGLGVIGVIAADLVVRTVLTGSPASTIGLWDGVFVVVGVTLIQRWYKQGQTASPNALTSSSGSSVLSCSECGHQNPAEVDFCTKCRAKMTLQCNKCGFKSPQGSEFCGSCGEPIRGPDEVYFENGQLKAKGTYKDGKWHGPYESYHQNGQAWKKGTYTDGKWHGPYEEYFEDGQLRYKGTFNMGFECDHWIVNGENRSYPRYPPA